MFLERALLDLMTDRLRQKLLDLYYLVEDSLAHNFYLRQVLPFKNIKFTLDSVLTT